ncbi:MAG: DNA replication/repair protein RecF [Acidimicrobiaceae bacterium]|nr:DNA replication/repair protein RecF [Acidimicrobiaceae bacterium]
MAIKTLELIDFRIYAHAAVEFDPGLTVIVGENGQGKTSLLEAISWIAGRGSFRGVADDSLIRMGADAAIVRADLTGHDGRRQLIEVELPRVGRNRVQINRQGLRRKSDLIGSVPVTIFSPDDLELVKGGPSSRRRWLDDGVASLQPGHDALCGELDKIIKQRNALLRSSGGRLDADGAFTLDVWDAKLATTGEALRKARERLLSDLAPRLSAAYDAVAGRPAEISAAYLPSWEGELDAALEQARAVDLRRGLSTIGPHRDEITLHIGCTPARTHASQGEQRSLVLAMRLAVDALVRRQGTAEPLLLLDDVFSELDAGRAQALLEALPESQRLLTTATWVPPAATPDRVLKVTAGAVTEVSR